MICNLNSFGFLEKQASDLLLTSPVRWNWTYERTSSGCKFLDWPFDSKRKAMCGGDHSLKPFAGLREDWLGRVGVEEERDSGSCVFKI